MNQNFGDRWPDKATDNIAWPVYVRQARPSGSSPCIV